MKLKDFLARLDFQYEICTANDPAERQIRRKLMESGELDQEDLEKPMLRLVDTTGANLGGIEGERFFLTDSLAEMLVERLDIYIKDYCIRDIEEALEEEGIETESMDLEDLVEKAKEIGLWRGIDYELADAVLHPETIEVEPWSFEQKILLVTPAFVNEMIADLEKSNLKTENGDRMSRYFPVAMGRGECESRRVEICLIEETVGIPENERGYAFHIINDVDETDCKYIQTGHMADWEAEAVLESILKRLAEGQM